LTNDSKARIYRVFRGGNRRPPDGTAGTACRPLLPRLERRSATAKCATSPRSLGAPATKWSATFLEKASGADSGRPERRKVLELARGSREITAILVTELSRWGRSTADLVQDARQSSRLRRPRCSPRLTSVFTSPHPAASCWAPSWRRHASTNVVMPPRL
jgi:resolvase-like protein